MIQPIDHSDRLGKVQALVAILREWAPEPTAEWCSHALFKKWQTRRYSLTTKEFGTLERFLERQHKVIECQKYAKNYVQIDLFGGGDEQNL